jgi:predicted nucleic acid-binding protein
MICLDTNYLILGLVPGSRESKDLIAWTQAGVRLIAPMPAWYEFICGPVTAPQIAAMRAFLHDLVPFDEPQALEAARLFNGARRKRSLRIDAMIAATAIVAGARLATNNRTDFSTFVPHGLKLL